ncbi:MAG TPA: hypothetical protein VHS31_01510 [Tepidisphaeraceae bacterium]|jgi:hypothetical protein|nr:hypothetical protein [Tepidisphaeraceae bacterium]
MQYFMLGLWGKIIALCTAACMLFVGNACVCGQMSVLPETKHCEDHSCCAMCRHTTPGQHRESQTCGHCHSLLTAETAAVKHLSPSLDQAFAFAPLENLDLFQIQSIVHLASTDQPRPFIDQTTLLGLSCALNT